MEKEMAEKIVSTILSEMLENEFSTQFALKVQRCIVKRNPEGKSPWEWDDINETLLYNNFEKEFESGIHTYCALRRVLKTMVTDEVIDRWEKEIKDNGEKLAEYKLEKYGWKKDGKGNNESCCGS